MSAENTGQMVRLAKLVIDEPQLAAYRALLIETVPLIADMKIK